VKYVLDTNVVSRVLDGDERALGALAAVEPQEVGIPLLVLAELVFGAEKSARREENWKRVEVITQRFPVLPMTLSLVERYAAVRAAVERRGRRKRRLRSRHRVHCDRAGCGARDHDAALKDGAIEGRVVEDWLDSGAP
jgi:predicted nucleic acid-binding protein